MPIRSRRSFASPLLHSDADATKLGSEPFFAVRIPAVGPGADAESAAEPSSEEGGRSSAKGRDDKGSEKTGSDPDFAELISATPADRRAGTGCRSRSARARRARP